MIIRVCVGVLMMIFAVVYYIWGTFFAFYSHVGFRYRKNWFDKFCHRHNMGQGRAALWIVTVLTFAACLCLQSVSVQFSDYMFIYGGCIVMLLFELVTLPLMAIFLSYFVEGVRLAFPGLVEKIRLFTLDNPWMLLLAFAFCIGMFYFTMNKRME